MRRLALLLAVIAVALGAIGSASGATPKPKPGWPVTFGERGTRVCDVLNLLHNYRPSRYAGNPRFTVLKGPIPGKASKCVFGRKAQRATSVLKYRLGYNKLFLGGQFGRKLYRYTIKGRGAIKRTEAMLVIAGKRYVVDAKAAAKAKAEAAKQNAWQNRLIETERREVGVRETSNNYSSRISVYQTVTGAYRAAWCMSFQQWGRVASGMSTIASRSAGVFYVVGWARNHALAGSVPHPGYLVAFVDGQGHIGLVTKVDTQGYYTVEGNHNNMVASVFHPHHSRSVIFIAAGPNAPRS